MKIYTGFGSPIEVTDEWFDILIDCDRIIYNNDQAQTRRHCSLESYNLDGNLLPSKENLEGQAVTKLTLEHGLKHLSREQERLVRAVHIEGVKVSEIAAHEGVSVSAVSHRLDRAMKKLKKVLK